MTIFTNLILQYDYIYKSNTTDKRKSSLEIDGIAVKKERCYVIECKGWRLPHLVDEPDKRNQIVRVVKGIVRGEKYSFKNGTQTVTKKPSLLEKIQYVEGHIHELFGNCDWIKMIEGLVVLSDYPGFSNIDGIKIITIDDIASL